jgi:hypothetical protein
VTLSVPGVQSVQPPTGALVVFNSYSFDPATPSISINGGAFINVPSVGSDWQSIAVPVPLEQIHDGTNTITFKATGDATVVANISIILVAGAPVP